jgi:transcription elongation factor GreA
MNDQPILTTEGAARIRDELNQLKGPQREALAKRLRDAISQGDLSENADYHKAKEDQAFLEGKIQELEYVIDNATIVDANVRNQGVVDIGCQVTIQEEGYTPETYLIVGAKEADSKNKKISYESPIGKALMDKKEGDSTMVTTPNGNITLKILEIK